MKIIILGAGQVGTSVAESLVSEANDITVVDYDGERLANLQERLDLRVVTGNAASPSILDRAGAADADLLIAVTQSDQTNLCACRVAKTLFNVPTRIARLRAADYEDHPQLLDDTNFAVDHSICPEQIVTDYIRKLIEFPEALQVLEFADGMVTMIAIRAFEGGLLVGKSLKTIPERLPNIDARIAAIFRHEQPIVPTGDTVIESGDEVFIIAASSHIRRVMTELRRMDQPIRRVIIAGGGNIGLRLAKAIENTVTVKLIERDRRRAEHLAAELERTVVLRGDSTDEALLDAESIEETDMFLALTNDEEDNIMSASLAKQMGARRTLALINRKSYVDLVQGGRIDIAISPAHTSIGQLLARVRRGDVAAVHSLRRGAAEALELVAHGDAKHCKVIGRKLEELDLPDGATIAAIVRQTGTSRTEYRDLVPYEVPIVEVIMAHHDTVIRPDDHVIVFCTSKKLVARVEKLFQVGWGFF
jgi:trk system potassium uptake protein TrkA